MYVCIAGRRWREGVESVIPGFFLFDDIDLCVSSGLEAGIVGTSRLGRSIVWCLGVLASAIV
jgi:hypothetical protein